MIWFAGEAATCHASLYAGNTSALSKSLGTACFAQSRHNPPNKLMGCESRKAPTSPPPPLRVSGTRGGPGSTLKLLGPKVRRGRLVLGSQVICLLFRAVSTHTHSRSRQRSPKQQKKCPAPRCHVSFKTTVNSTKIHFKASASWQDGQTRTRLTFLQEK